MDRKPSLIHRTNSGVSYTVRFINFVPYCTVAWDIVVLTKGTCASSLLFSARASRSISLKVVVVAVILVVVVVTLYKT